MAEYLIKENRVITGGDNQEKYLYHQLKNSIAKADSIDIIVSFLMESGVRMLLDNLKSAVDRNVPIRILTGNYLGITQPEALYLVKKELGDKVDLRFYDSKGRSFHPKAYFFHYGDISEVYVGSSNMSRSALTSGIEWNYRLSNTMDEASYLEFYSTFEDLFQNHSILIDDDVLKNYAKSWKRPNVYKDIEKHEKEDKSFTVTSMWQPRGAQVEALYALAASREEGAVKGLVHAATGIGKTYLAAFDSRDYEKVLFVAHRERLIKQAAQTFYNVRKSDDYGFIYGNQKDFDKSVIFATVQTLGQDKYYTKFPKDYFDYIIIDEFHHAVVNQYKKIIEYFEPKFMLGLTATPERMDGRSVYELCDYNVPYEITLQDSINRGFLVPFHYYGIYDETDYSNIHIVKGRYDENELNLTYLNNIKRYNLIERWYKKYGSTKALAFCCSIAHAEDMAREFNKRGIRSEAIYSGSSMKVSEAIEKLEKEEINVIFSVDMFSEGVDIPALDMVMFLRPTESSTVFLQQLGRGLRKYDGKEYVNVLDFIGNYEKAGRTPFLLSGKPYSNKEASEKDQKDYDVPQDCFIDFDLRLIDLFKEMASSNLKVEDKILKEYESIKDYLGHVPSRIELFENMSDEVYILCRKNSKHNIFRDYLGYLEKNNDLSEEEKTLYSSYGREFINLIETTAMSKSYKMPVLNAFYNGGKVRNQLNEEELLVSWKDFFRVNGNWKDLTGATSYEAFLKMTDKQHLDNILKNPVNFLIKSGKGMFIKTDEYPVTLTKELEPALTNDAFIKHMKDAIDYRTKEYYRSRYAEE